MKSTPDIDEVIPCPRQGYCPVCGSALGYTNEYPCGFTGDHENWPNTSTVTVVNQCERGWNTTLLEAPLVFFDNESGEMI